MVFPLSATLFTNVSHREYDHYGSRKRAKESCTGVEWEELIEMCKGAHLGIYM